MSLKLRRNITARLMAVFFAIPFFSFSQERDEKITFPLDNFYVKIKKNNFRKVFKNFRFSGSMGYGRTHFSHSLDGYGIYQSPVNGPFIFKLGPGNPVTGHSRWIDSSQPISINVQPGDLVIKSDTAKLKFKSKSITLPMKLMLYYDFKKFRIGGGVSKEFIPIAPFKPRFYSDKIRTVDSVARGISVTKYFGYAGISFFRIDKNLFTGDLQAGTYRFGKNFDQTVITRSLFFSGGITMERELSEYFRIFLRPAYEVKSYKVSLPESSSMIKHNANSFTISFGFIYSLPELRKCYIKTCFIQINHAHGNREYRSRVHPIFKKQNPGYGENHPSLVKYKRGNKRKINPY